MKVIATLGDYYHDESFYKEALSQATSGMEDIDLVYATRENLIDKLRDKPDLVILASENRLNPNEGDVRKWLTKKDELEIINYVNDGGSWFAWHSGLASYEGNSSYIGMLGGYFTHHPDQHVNVRYQFNEKHELSNGKESFEIMDEHYFIESNEEISIFLNSISEYGESVAGWTKRYGEGRVCGYSPAHNKDGLLNAAVQADLKDIIKWLVKIK